MVSFNEISEALRANAEKSINYVLGVVGELIEEIEGKDEEIEGLHKSIEKLSNELKAYMDKNATNQNTINELLRELKQVKNRQSENIVIVASPKDAFVYSKDIALKYISKIDWMKISYEQTVDMLNAALETRNVELIDEVIIYITDNRLKSLSKEQFESLLAILKSEIGLNKEQEDYSANGLFYLLNRVEELGWVELLKPYMKELAMDLVSIAIRADSKEECCNNAMLLLRILFLIDETEKWEACFKLFLEDSVFSGQLENDQSLELLYISMYYNSDSTVVDSIASVTRVLTYNLPEVKCYQLYYEAVQDPKLLEGAIKEVKDLERQCNIINIRIKQKVFKRINAYMNIELGKYNRTMQDIPQNQNEKHILSNNLPVATEVYLIKKTDTKCQFDGFDLSVINCDLAFYDDNKKAIKGFITYKVLYCKLCKRFYINSDIQEKIKPLLQTNKLKITSNNVIKPINKIVQNSSKQLTNINNSNSINKESYDDDGSTYDNIDLKNVKDESDIYKLGYKLELSREQRWDIIRRLAIPKLGPQQIIHHLHSLITWRSTQKRDRFRRAIMEWEYDIKRIKEYYNIK